MLSNVAGHAMKTLSTYHLYMQSNFLGLTCCKHGQVLKYWLDMNIMNTTQSHQFSDVLPGGDVILIADLQSLNIACVKWKLQPVNFALGKTVLKTLYNAASKSRITLSNLLPEKKLVVIASKIAT